MFAFILALIGAGLATVTGWLGASWSIGSVSVSTSTWRPAGFCGGDSHVPVISRSRASHPLPGIRWFWPHCASRWSCMSWASPGFVGNQITRLFRFFSGEWMRSLRAEVRASWLRSTSYSMTTWRNPSPRTRICCSKGLTRSTSLADAPASARLYRPRVTITGRFVLGRTGDRRSRSSGMQSSGLPSGIPGATVPNAGGCHADASVPAPRGEDKAT